MSYQFYISLFFNVLLLLPYLGIIIIFKMKKKKVVYEVEEELGEEIDFADQIEELMEEGTLENNQKK